MSVHMCVKTCICVWCVYGVCVCHVCEVCMLFVCYVVCVCNVGYVCVCVSRVRDLLESGVPPHRFPGSHLGHQVWPQVPFPTEVSGLPNFMSYQVQN